MTMTSDGEELVQVSPPSDTWCINAEYSLSVGTDGGCMACCMADGGVLDEKGHHMNVAVHSIEEIHASPHLMRVRENLQNGIKDPMCKKCWNEEAAGRDSKRLRDNKYVKFSTPPVQGDIKILELNLGNTCNIKCRTCSPHSSSQWVREWFDLVAKKGNPALQWDDYRKQKTQHTILYDSDSSFWESVHRVAPSVEILDFYGGEPFLIKKQWQFIKHCVEQDIAKNKSLHYNTNCTTWPTEHIQYLPKFMQLNMGLSIDGVGEHDHFIRFPTVWADVDENVDRWYQYGMANKNSRISVCMTLSPMNILYIPEMMEYVDEKNEKFGSNKLSLYLNLIHLPAHYNISNMPDYFKKAVTEKLQPHIGRNNYLEGILQFMNNGVYDATHWKVFRQKIRDNDEYRGQNFATTFPEVHEILGRNNDAIYVDV